jgi:hypothetical protein
MRSSKGFMPVGTTASAFGAIAGLANMAYGFAEASLGHARPVAVFFTLNGQPALTVIPDMLLTGLIGMALSLVYAAWALFFVQRRRGGLVMILLACAQIPFGAGLVRISQAIIFGLIGTGIGRPLKIWGILLPESTRPFLSRLWPVSFLLCAILYVIHVLTGIIPELSANESLHSALVIIGGYGNLVMFLVVIATGFARELEMKKDSKPIR